MLILATLIFGGIALSTLSVNLLPDVDSPTMIVQTDWSGVAPREVEQRINEPLEGVLSTVQGLETIHGFARQGQSVISLQFRWGQNMDLAFLNVREKLDQVRFLLPEQAERPQLVHNTASDEPIAVLGISSKDHSNQDFETRLSLKRWADQVLSRRLEQAEGIAQAVLVGAVEPEVQIRYRPKALNRYGVTLGEVQNLVEQSNLFTATGELRDGWYRYSLKIQSRIQSIDDVQRIPVKKLGDGKILTVGDVASVQMDEADPTSFALVDGRRILSILIKKEFGANTVEAYDTMLPLLEEMRGQNPSIEIMVLSENATFIRNTINNLLQTLLYGAALAFVILFLFLDDLRTPLTIGVAIPVSIFLTFFVMYASDIQLNIVSLSGLTLGIGLLVDNAIIVLENINRHRKYGKSLLEAASAGTREITLAVSASTFTTISVFLPLVFIGGFEGAFFKDQAWTLSISLLASLLVALMILPVLVVQVQKKASKKGLLGFSGYFDRIRNRYEASLQWALGNRAWFIGGMMGLLGLAVWQFYGIDKSILPATEPDQLQYQVRLPGNTSLNSTMQAAIALTEQAALGNGKNKVQSLGGFTDQTNLSNLSEEGLNKFTISIPVNGFNEARRVEKRVAGFFEAHPGWTVKEVASGDQFGMLPGADQPPVLFRLVGENREQSERLVQALRQELSQHGLSVDLQKQFREEVQTYQLRFKADRLLQLGITERQIIQYLESLTRGSRVTDWNRQDENIPIRLVGLDRTIRDPNEIVLNINDTKIPLPYLVDINRASEPEQLERVNQTPVLSYIADLDFAGWWWNGEQIRNSLTQFARDTGTEVQTGGSALAVARLLGEMGTLLLISVLIIYLILAIQFESLKYPVIILCAIPFAWVGSIANLWITGSSLNALSFMGILILTGIAVNDSILKVDFMRRYLVETENLKQAVTQAGLHRFRPVVMTSLTTIFGLIPMLIPFGDGYAFRQSLALALMGGMVTSTILTLYLIPIIFDWAEKEKARPT
jgi:HAE1 family hydrophobic/amphiphilic exporter-1